MVRFAECGQDENTCRNKKSFSTQSLGNFLTGFEGREHLFPPVCFYESTPIDSSKNGRNIRHMPFPHFHSDSGRESLKRAAELSIASHGQPEHRLSPEAAAIRSRKRTGIELSGPELAYLQHAMSEKIGTLENKISALERSVAEGSAPNSENAREDAQKLKQELDFLRHNFVEKLFKKTEDADNEVAISI